MIRIWLSICYSLLAYVLFDRAEFFMNRDVSSAQFIYLAKVLPSFLEKEFLYSIIFLLVFLMSCLCIFIHKKTLRIIVFFLFLMAFYMDMSFGKVLYQYHIWLVAIIFVCFLDEKRNLASTFNRNLIHIAQAVCLSHYFLSGLWKIRIPIEKGFPKPLYELALAPIADALEKGLDISSFFMNFFINYPWLTFLGWFFTLFFQLSCIIPILTGKYYVLWGSFALAFHLTTGVAMGIYFKQTVLAVLFFLIFTEKLIDYESKVNELKKSKLIINLFSLQKFSLILKNFFSALSFKKIIQRKIVLSFVFIYMSVCFFVPS